MAAGWGGIIITVGFCRRRRRRVPRPGSVATKLTENEVYGNELLGIDVENDGVTHAGLPDVSAAVAHGNGDVTLTFRLTGALAGNYVIELFASPAADDSGFGEGKMFVASAVVSYAGGDAEVSALFVVPADKGGRSPLGDVLLMNGPGTCVVLCACVWIARFVGWRTPRMVYVESFARVRTLSLSGQILDISHFVLQ